MLLKYPFFEDVTLLSISRNSLKTLNKLDKFWGETLHCQIQLF